LTRKAPATSARQVEFHLTQTVSPTPFTGRVYVMLSKTDIKGLPSRPKWINPEPFFAQDVTNWRPGSTLVLGEKLLGYPVPLAKLPHGTYSVQAVMDLDQANDGCITAAGNGYSKPMRREFGPTDFGHLKVHIDQVYPAKTFKQTERVKLVDIESHLLSKFHGRPIRMRAAVLLPRSFLANPDRRYPMIYEVPGFNGTHHLAFMAETRNATEVAGLDMIHVTLDPSCRLGHHVFADSANNGPCGQALIEELIPHIERTFRGLGTPAARFVTGHSSGGWSSLWLQVTYPDFFGGVWSTAPDPVDFRDFQRVNIYAKEANLFIDPLGKERPLVRKSGKVLVHYKPFSDMEVVLGRSGQLFSFEAVFGPRGPDGRPMPLWDRTTGRIDPVVAKSWQRYDIRLQLQRNWESIAPKLRGKIHVYMGAEDNFYLEGATVLLKQTLAGLGSDAVVEIFPGRDHSTLIDPALRQRIAAEMAEQYRKNSSAPLRK
jgi:hypothetical protein